MRARVNEKKLMASNNKSELMESSKREMMGKWPKKNHGTISMGRHKTAKRRICGNGARWMW